MRVMTDLESRSGGQLSKFFTAHGYGKQYDAPRLQNSSKAAKVAAVLQAAEREGQDEELLSAACAHFDIEILSPPTALRVPGDQARQVRAWVDVFAAPPILQVANNSDAPIRDLVPTVLVWSETTGASLGGTPFWKHALAELPPFSAFAWRIDHLGEAARDTASKTELHLDFDDAAGQRWRLGHDSVAAIPKNAVALQYVDLTERPQPVEDLKLPESVSAQAAPSAERSVFLSYVREDAALVDRLQHFLETKGVTVWRDRDSLIPGENWKTTIRRMITEGCFAFIACFSSASVTKAKSYMNEELSLARDELRSRNTTNWFVPVMLTDCTLPDLDIGLHGRLTDIEQCRLYSDWDRETRRLLTAIRRLA